jgi:hypothetical protein
MKCRRMLWAFVICFSGCAGAVPPGMGSGEVLTFAVQGKTYDEVWSTIERVAGQSLTIVDRDKAFGSLKATKGVLMGPWGDVIEFSIRPAHSGAPEYSVELASFSQPGSRLPAEDWEHTMVDKIKSELGQ